MTQSRMNGRIEIIGSCASHAIHRSTCTSSPQISSSSRLSTVAYLLTAYGSIPYFRSERMPGQGNRSAYQATANYRPEESYQHQQNVMSGYGQPAYNPQYQNPGGYAQQGGYPQQHQPPPAPPGWAPSPSQAGSAPYPMPHAGAADHHMEGGAADKYAFGFSDATIRAAFVRKVFALVTIMLAVVAVMTAIPWFDDGLKASVKRSMGLYLASYATFFVVYLVLMCCENVRRSFPVNIIMTGILTVSIGFMTMMITAHHDIQIVLLALIVTTVACGSIIIFATVTKHDLTSMLGVMFILSMCLFAFGLLAIIGGIFFKVYWLHSVYAGLAALLFMFYLAIDVQMLMGGRKYEISPEDHIFAAIQIFLDIVYIFWMLVSLFGSSNN